MLASLREQFGAKTAEQLDLKAKAEVGVGVWGGGEHVIERSSHCV